LRDRNFHAKASAGQIDDPVRRFGMGMSSHTAYVVSRVELGNPTPQPPLNQLAGYRKRGRRNAIRSGPDRAPMTINGTS
jgi:hypothetical protein